MVAAGQRTAPLQLRLPKVRAHQQLGGLVRAACTHLAPGGRQPGARARAAGSLAADAHQHREQALHLEERTGRGPAEGTPRPHTAALLFELTFDEARAAGSGTQSPDLASPSLVRSPSGAVGPDQKPGWFVDPMGRPLSLPGGARPGPRKARHGRAADDLVRPASRGRPSLLGIPAGHLAHRTARRWLVQPERRRLLLHRLLEAEECLARRRPEDTGMRRPCANGADRR